MSVSFLEKQYSEEEIYSILEPELREWFFRKYKKFTPAQKYAVYEIHKGENVLISSPTGSGKTLSAFLSIINELLKMKKNAELEDKVYCIYISPLRALNNDIKRNLEDPLKEIEKRTGEKIGIRVGIRTSDTTSYEKSKMSLKPPHILITTPESLAISLNSPKFSEMLPKAKYIIIDEIHSIADSKRGSHLSLSIERLEAMRAETATLQSFGQKSQEMVRIGLSATVSLLEEVAKFLVGTHRNCKIADISYEKKTEIKVISPIDDFIYSSQESQMKSMYDLLDKLIKSHETTLIFTNTRSATERVVFHLSQKFPENYKDLIAPHHSSLSREARLEVEEKLKRGELKVVVTSTSLELGIDIGNIDLVILLGSPKSVSRALQRIGRSGHKLHETSEGCLVVLDRDDLVENLIIATDALSRKYDKIRIANKPLDVLSQHVLGMSLTKKWQFEEALGLIRKSYPYKELEEAELKSILNFLSGAYDELEQKRIYSKLWYENNEFGKKGKLSRILYFMNIGTIPDETHVRVMTRANHFVGKIDEEFAERLIQGDVFVLGGKTYEFVYSRGNTAYVDSAEHKKPTIPSWFSETLPLSYEVALDIENFRDKISKFLEQKGPKALAEFLQENYALEENASKAIAGYFLEQKTYAKIPDSETLLVEEFIDEGGLKNYIFHTMCGRKANEALARVFAHFAGELKNSNVKVSFNDYGIMLTFPKFKHLKENELERIINFKESEFLQTLKKALNGSELFRRRFRQVAVRSLAVLRKYPKRGRELTVGMQQMSSDGLLRLLKDYYPNFPVLQETEKEVMQIAMHVDEAMDYLSRLKKKKIMFLRELKIPTPFAFNIVLTGAKDVVMLEDRKKFVEKMHKMLMERIKNKL